MSLGVLGEKPGTKVHFVVLPNFLSFNERRPAPQSPNLDR